MKRYAVFAGATYYPAAGIASLAGVFQTADIAISEAKKLTKESKSVNGERLGDYDLGWWQVVDLLELTVIAGCGDAYGSDVEP